VAEELSLVARRIKEIREAKKWSRQQLARKLGVTYLQVYRIENGKVHVSADTAASFADALEVSVASLFRQSRAAAS
jgi:transcriptional regulator with XRE-family HTH domain